MLQPRLPGEPRRKADAFDVAVPPVHPPLSASAQTATGHDVLVSESQEFAEKLTPPFVGSAIARWYKATSPLEKEYPTFLPSAPTLPTIRPASFA